MKHDDLRENIMYYIRLPSAYACNFIYNFVQNLPVMYETQQITDTYDRHYIFLNYGSCFLIGSWVGGIKGYFCLFSCWCLIVKERVSCEIDNMLTLVYSITSAFKQLNSFEKQQLVYNDFANIIKSCTLN